MKCCRILALVALAHTSTFLPAQAPPRFGVAGAIGPTVSRGGEFRASSGVARELTISARVASVRGFTILGTAAVGSLHWTGDVTTICVPSVHGGCAPYGPMFRGESVRVGIERSIATRLSLAASAGLGWYDWTGGEFNHTHGAHAFPVDLRAKTRLLAHGGALVGVHRLAISVARISTCERRSSVHIFSESPRRARPSNPLQPTSASVNEV
jgi:hypothetical protein